jgi:hypothetical protein
MMRGSSGLYENRNFPFNIDMLYWHILRLLQRPHHPEFSSFVVPAPGMGVYWEKVRGETNAN